MIRRVVRTSAAENDLVEIGVYIAGDDLTAAIAVLDRIEAHCQSLARHPFMGERCPHLGPDLRQSTVGSYVVYHQPVGNEIVIIRVLHGARDIDSLFDRGE